jgi:hypothetical protein
MSEPTDLPTAVRAELIALVRWFESTERPVRVFRVRNTIVRITKDNGKK